MTQGFLDARFHETPTAVSVSVPEKLLFISPTYFADVRSIARTLATLAVLPWVTTKLFWWRLERCVFVRFHGDDDDTNWMTRIGWQLLVVTNWTAIWTRQRFFFIFFLVWNQIRRSSHWPGLWNVTRNYIQFSLSSVDPRDIIVPKVEQSSRPPFYFLLPLIFSYFNFPR